MLVSMEVQVPDGLSFVKAFLNSVDVESGGDDFVDLRGFRRWLRDNGRTSAARTASEPDLHLARRLRTALRQEVAAHHEGIVDAGGTSDLNEISAEIPLRTTFVDGGTTLAPAGAGVPAVLGEVLAAIAVADMHGEWERLKICPAGDCAWVFFDPSKNRSKRWCSMAVCGNRAKTRSYRQRST
jgi:predicted RNA-binding Zn ribbon-like protein